MGTSTNFNTADRIIRQALKNAGLLQDGDDPSGEVYADCMNRLNDLVNLWQTKGLKLFLNRSTIIDLDPGVATYSVVGSAGKIMRVLEGYYLDASGLERPLEALSWNTYGALTNKSSTGIINSYFVDKQKTITNVSFWLVPDAVTALGSVRLLVQDMVPNLVNLTDAMQFPNEWFAALHWGLADEICTGQPQSIVMRCEQRARMYREALENWDVEDAPISFAPNTEGQASAFR